MSDKTQLTRVVRTRQASASRREQKKLDLRRMILDEASREFLEHGYENFSLRRVAERIGYTPTTIYLHFHNKDELLLETAKDGFTNFDEAIAEAARSNPLPLPRIEALGRAYIQFGLDHPALYRLMFMQRSDFYFMPHLVGRGTPEGEVREILPGQHRAVAQELLIVAVEEAVASGEIAPQDATNVADALWAGVHGLVALAISPLMMADHVEDVTNQLLHLLIAGLKTPPIR